MVIYQTRTGARAPARRHASWAAAAALLVLAFAGPAAAGNEIKPNGRWTRFEIKTPGGRESVLFRARSGVRYRVTVEPKTLDRPIVELYQGRSEAPALTLRGDAGQPVTLDWQAHGDSIAEVRVQAFSLGTGKGQIKLEPLDWDGNPTKKETRWLGLRDDELHAVSDLVLGQTDIWRLAVEPGGRYEIGSNQGGVARVRLRVFGIEDALVADSNDWWIPGDPAAGLRFEVTAREGPATLRLEVAAVWPSAGDYGVRLTRLAEQASVLPPDAVVALPDREAAEVEGQPLTFTLGEGDMAVLWIPDGHPLPQRAVSMELRGTWIPVEGRSASERDLGQIARGQRPGLGNFQSFRPYQAGTYRFSGGGRRESGQGETLRLYTREVLGPPPVHMGTNEDPVAHARTTSGWQPIGLGICVPGITYVFVAVGAASAGVGMRVRSLDGRTIATRPTSGHALPVVAGHGPSLRFRVSEPSVVRLEAIGGRTLVAALLRELESGD